MTNIIKKYEEEHISKLVENKEIPDFKAGDTVRVSVRVVDGNNERLQAYEGVVIARSNRGVCSSFLVRKISHGEGVERRFMLYSPIVHKIEVVKRGIVRRAKLYYLRKLSGRAARIREKKFFTPKVKKEKVVENKNVAAEKTVEKVVEKKTTTKAATKTTTTKATAAKKTTTTAKKVEKKSDSKKAD